MTTYLIELYVPSCVPLLREGPARQLRTILVPSDESAYCLVEASSPVAAAALAASLGLEPERIVEAVAYEPEDQPKENHEHEN